MEFLSMVILIIFAASAMKLFVEDSFPHPFGELLRLTDRVNWHRYLQAIRVTLAAHLH